MRILFDLFSLTHAAVPGIAIHHIIVLANQLMGLIDIMNVGASGCNGVDISAAGVDSGMDFHSEVPLVAFLRLMHFRIALAGSVLNGAWSADDGCVNDGAAVHHEAGFLQALFHVGEDFLSDFVLFQKAAELQKRGCVRDLLVEEIQVKE